METEIKTEFSFEMGNQDRIICPICQRYVWVENGFITTHKEDKGGSTICNASGYAI